MTLLLADDDDVYRERLARAIGARGHSVITARNGEEAILLSSQSEMDAAILDLKMPEHNGIDVLRAIMKSRPHMRILIHTGYGSIATAMEAVRLGAIDYLIKPTDVDSLLSALDPNQEELPKPPQCPHQVWRELSGNTSNGSSPTVTATLAKLHASSDCIADPCKESFRNFRRIDDARRWMQRRA